MSYLNFDKKDLINLEESLHKEMLRTNKSGAYHCTTLVDCNTRKYHGLLVIPVPEIDNDNHVLLSSFDETVIQHGAPFNLGLHEYQGKNFSPNGHKYIREFNCDITPSTIFRVGGVILKKEKIFTSHDKRILFRYTLLDAHSPTTLQFRPFLAFRNVNRLMKENNNIDRSYEIVDNGIGICPYKPYPTLFMQFNKEVKFIDEQNWYNGIEYFKEMERGYEFKEDLYVPGYFEIPIEKGESIIISAGISTIETKLLAAKIDEEIGKRVTRTDFFNCLKNSAQQLFNRDSERRLYILAGYPWFKVRARDQFIALPGSSIATNDLQAFDEIMNASLPSLESFIKGEPTDPMIEEIDQPDVLFWAIWAIQQYYNEVSKDEAIKRYYKFVSDVVQYIIKDKHPTLFTYDNGLVYANGRQRAISWMNSTVDGIPIVPRSGFLVEFNALWYNTICFAREMAEQMNDMDTVRELNEWAAKVGNSFVKVFKNDYGYLFDYVDGDREDWSVRPNMLFAAALPYSPLSRQEQKTILDYITKELLTPKGIRSLSPKSAGYNPIYVGNDLQRRYAYHQGTAWPWLVGFYVEAYLKIFKMSGFSFAERTLIGFEDEMKQHCIGSIAELFDGNPPFKGRGAISFAMNVAEILRAMRLLKKYESEI